MLCPEYDDIASMAYGKFNLRAEVGKLSQGKQTTIPVDLIAKLVLDQLQERERDGAVEELERLYRL